MSSVPTLGASDYWNLYQNLAPGQYGDLGWGTLQAATVTLSFYVRSSVVGTFGGSIRPIPTNRSFAFGYTIAAAGVWQQVSVVIPGDTCSTCGWGTTLQLAFTLFATAYIAPVGNDYRWVTADYITVTGQANLAATVGAYWHVTGVQLEKSNVATAFDVRPYNTELVPFGTSALTASSPLVNATNNMYSTIHMRSIVTKSYVDSVCPTNTQAVYTPLTMRGWTGAQICAASRHCLTVCIAAKYVYATIANSGGTYAPSDTVCGAPLMWPWPWGNSNSVSNPLASDWGYGDTHVVCCQTPSGSSTTC